jgi:hypothetical protein
MSYCVSFINDDFPVQALNLKFNPHGFSFSIKSLYVLCLFQNMKLLTILWHVSHLNLSEPFVPFSPIYLLGSTVLFLSVIGMTDFCSNLFCRPFGCILEG